MLSPTKSIRVQILSTNVNFVRQGLKFYRYSDPEGYRNSIKDGYNNFYKNKKEIMKTAFVGILLLGVLLAPVANGAACEAVTGTFPTDDSTTISAANADITSSGTGNQLSTATNFDCDQQATTTNYGFVRLKMGYVTTSLKAANVCWMKTAVVDTGAFAFMWTIEGAFKKADATTTVSAWSSGATGDDVKTANTEVFYAGAQSIYYTYAISTGTTQKANAAIANLYCYDGVGATTACSTPSSGALTAALSTATDIEYAAATTKGQSACVVTITPSATSDVGVTTSATTGSTTPAIGTSSKTASTPTYAGSRIITNAATTFTSSMEVKLLVLSAVADDAATPFSSAVSIVVTITAASTSSASFLAPVLAIASSLFFLF